MYAVLYRNYTDFSTSTPLSDASYLSPGSCSTQLLKALRMSHTSGQNYS